MRGKKRNLLGLLLLLLLLLPCRHFVVNYPNAGYSQRRWRYRTARRRWYSSNNNTNGIVALLVGADGCGVLVVRRPWTFLGDGFGRRRRSRAPEGWRCHFCESRATHGAFRLPCSGRVVEAFGETPRYELCSHSRCIATSRIPIR